MTKDEIIKNTRILSIPSKIEDKGRIIICKNCNGEGKALGMEDSLSIFPSDHADCNKTTCCVCKGTGRMRVVKAYVEIETPLS